MYRVHSAWLVNYDRKEVCPIYFASTYIFYIPQMQYFTVAFAWVHRLSMLHLINDLTSMSLPGYLGSNWTAVPSNELHKSRMLELDLEKKIWLCHRLLMHHCAGRSEVSGFYCVW